MTWFATATRSVAIAGQPKKSPVKSKRAWYKSQVFGNHRPLFLFFNTRPSHELYGNPSYWSQNRRKNVEYLTQKVFGNPALFIRRKGNASQYVFGNASYWNLNRRKNLDYLTRKVFMHNETIPIGRWICENYDESEDWTCN